MDPLAGLLNDVRTHGAVFGQSILQPPWSVRFDDDAALTIVVPISGVVWVHPGNGPRNALPARVANASAVDRGAEPVPVPLRVGDVAIVVGEAPFTVADSSHGSTAGRPTVHRSRQEASVDAGVVEADPTRRVRRCDDPDDGATVLLTGSYRVAGRVSRRLLDALPRTVVVRDEGEMCPLMDVTFAEIGRDKPGQQAVLDRLLDLLVLTTLREWFDRPDVDPPGWYRALGDPVVGPAVRLMHDAPERPWTVATLAAEVAASRATLARRFGELVGEPPMVYLRSQRLGIAADLLQRPDTTVDSVARQVGYASGYSLSVAFERHYGARPSDFQPPRTTSASAA